MSGEQKKECISKDELKNLTSRLKKFQLIRQTLVPS